MNETTMVSTEGQYVGENIDILKNKINTPYTASIEQLSSEKYARLPELNKNENILNKVIEYISESNTNLYGTVWISVKLLFEYKHTGDIKFYEEKESRKTFKIIGRVRTEKIIKNKFIFDKTDFDKEYINQLAREKEEFRELKKARIAGTRIETEIETLLDNKFGDLLIHIDDKQRVEQFISTILSIPENDFEVDHNKKRDNRTFSDMELAIHSMCKKFSNGKLLGIFDLTKKVKIEIDEGKTDEAKCFYIKQSSKDEKSKKPLSRKKVNKSEWIKKEVQKFLDESQKKLKRNLKKS